MSTVTALEDYFDFIRTPDDTLLSVRVTGTRVGIEYILRDYMQGASPEELALRFPTLTLEQIHATITYSLAHKDEVAGYLRSVSRRQHADANQPIPKGQAAFVQALRDRLNDARRDLASGDPPLSIAAD